jgi:hypothetical protein
VGSQRVCAHDEVLNALGVELGQQISEVGVERRHPRSIAGTAV